MSISLNNHENRIKALESNPKITKLLTYDSSSVDLNYNFGTDWQKYDYLWFFIDHSRNYTTIPPIQGVYRGSRYIPVKALKQLYPITFPAAISFFHSSPELTNPEHCEWIMCEVAADGKIWFKHTSSSAQAYTDNRIHVFGILTKYYFVRNNIIYRATHLLEKISYVLNKGGVSL